jgi:hypothetical protein
MINFNGENDDLHVMYFTTMNEFMYGLCSELYLVVVN